MVEAPRQIGDPLIDIVKFARILGLELFASESELSSYSLQFVALEANEPFGAPDQINRFQCAVAQYVHIIVLTEGGFL